MFTPVYMHVSLSIWHRNVHGIHQNLSWISLNTTNFVLVSLLYFSSIQTIVLFLPHPVVGVRLGLVLSLLHPRGEESK